MIRLCPLVVVTQLSINLNQFNAIISIRYCLIIELLWAYYGFDWFQEYVSRYAHLFTLKYLRLPFLWKLILLFSHKKFVKMMRPMTKNGREGSKATLIVGLVWFCIHTTQCVLGSVSFDVFTVWVDTRPLHWNAC